MYCNHCGNPLQPNQSTCPKCASVVVTPFMLSRVERHLRILAVLWLAYATLHLFGALVVWLAANVILGPMGPAHHVPLFLRPFLNAIGFLVLAKGALGIAAGYGLLHRLSWARVLTLVLAFISLLNIPLGTALGIYTLWVLFSPTSESDYMRLAASA